MLQAKSHNGKLVTLAGLSKQKIEWNRKNTQYFCPVCNQKVIVKAGNKMIPHFAHVKRGSCFSRGGEGAYHNSGKLLLYQWLKSQHLQVELEKYIPEIRQQPDILLTMSINKIAIEFQCARIPPSELKKRLTGYEKVGIKSVWILAAKRLVRQGSLGIKINDFTRLFIQQHSLKQLPKLLYFCPETLQFTVVQDLYYTTLTRAIGTYSIKPINQMRITCLFRNISLTKHIALKRWQFEKKKLRLQRNSTHLKSQEYQWQQWLYLKRTHREYLPSFIYLPVTNHFKMKSAPWNWQSRLCLDLLEPMKLGHVFTLKHVIHFLNHHIYAEQDYPLAINQPHPISNYLNLLEKLNVISKSSQNEFVKITPIIYHKHIEQSLYKDRETLKILYNRL